jgi:hypothetical protein
LQKLFSITVAEFQALDPAGWRVRKNDPRADQYAVEVGSG